MHARSVLAAVLQGTPREWMREFGRVSSRYRVILPYIFSRAISIGKLGVIRSNSKSTFGVIREVRTYSISYWVRLVLPNESLILMQY
jgi:hypothetical protein